MLNTDDEIKFEKIRKIYQCKIFNYAIRMVKDNLIAEEVTINILFKLRNRRILNKFSDLQSNDTILYIAKMTKKACLKEIKKRSKVA